MNHVLNFASRPMLHHHDRRLRDYAAEAAKLAAQVKAWGWNWIGYDQAWLENRPIYQLHQSLFDGPYCGYFFFKPYAICQALISLPAGDTLIWSDAANVFKRRPDGIVAHAQRCGLWAHEHSGGINPEGDWTKRDTFIIMGADVPAAWGHPQARVDLIAFEASAANRAFCIEWMNYAQDPRCLTDSPNEMGLPNLPGFREHRREQSIFSLLCFKKGITLQPDPLGNLYDKVACYIDGEGGQTWEARQ